MTSVSLILDSKCLTKIERYCHGVKRIYGSQCLLATQSVYMQMTPPKTKTKKGIFFQIAMSGSLVMIIVFKIINKIIIYQLPIFSDFFLKKHIFFY